MMNMSKNSKRLPERAVTRDDLSLRSLKED